MSKTNPSMDATKMINAAKEFETAKIDVIKRNNKLAWRICGLSLITTLAAISAVAFLAPLKTVEPYVIRVDNNTGQTDIVYALKEQKIAKEQAMDRYWLRNYVMFRESYDWNTVQSNYNTTMAFSSDKERKQIENFYSSEQAPYKIFKNDYRVDIKIISISYVGELAQVRFERKLQDLRDLNKQPVIQKIIATIAYEYQNQAVPEEERLVNPLGFKITSYTTDIEH